MTPDARHPALGPAVRIPPANEFVSDELVGQLNRGNLSSIAVSSALSLLVVFIFRDFVSPEIAYGWLGVSLSYNVFRVWYLRRLASARLHSGAAIMRRYAILAGLAGLIWGAGGILFFPTDHIEFQVFLAFVLGGLSAGSASMYAPYPPAFYAIVLPMLLPIIVRFYLATDELSIVMGTMLLLYGAFIASVAHSINRTIRQAIALQIDRLRMADEQRFSEEFFSKAFQASPVVISVTDPDTSEIFDINRAWEELSGYRREDVVGRHLRDLNVWFDPEDREKFVTALKGDGSLRGREIKMRGKDGQIYDLLASGELIDSNSGPRFLFIGQDVTQIKEVARIKSEFISIVSHELRTPLTSILGALGILLSNSFSDLPEKARSLISIAMRNTNRLTNIVNDLLDFQKLQSGTVAFEFNRHDLTNIVRDAIDQCRPYTDEFGVRVAVTTPSHPIYVRADEGRLNQVVVNILSNAAKFSPRNSEVAVSVATRDGYGRVAISDHGPGIPDIFREKIFDRFSQADTSATRAVGGTGLGLNICKSIMDAHDGIIDFSTTVGLGTTFYFDVPLFEVEQ